MGLIIRALGSSFFLKERLSFVGKVGIITRKTLLIIACALCLVGASIIVVKLPLYMWIFSRISAPSQKAVTTIQDMQKFVISPGFLVSISSENSNM